MLEPEPQATLGVGLVQKRRSGAWVRAWPSPDASYSLTPSSARAWRA